MTLFRPPTRRAVPSPPPGGAGPSFSLLFFSSNEADTRRNKYDLLLESARFADRNGFEALWLPERHFHPFGGIFPNPSTVGAAVAMVTERIRIRAGSVVMPLHNPIRVAEEWSVVDNLSRGRVDLSFAVGWNPVDFSLAPEHFAQRVELTYAGIQTVKELWKGAPLAVRDGQGLDATVRLHPAPAQSQLAMWMTCSGGKERFVEAGSRGFNVLTALLFQSMDEVREKIAAYREARAAAGFDPSTGKVTLMLHTFVSDDMAFVREKVRPPFIQYLESSIDLWKRQAVNLAGMSPEEKAGVLDYAFERYFQSAGLFGTPRSCEAMTEAARAAGVNEIACLIDFGVDTTSVLAALQHLNQLRARYAEVPTVATSASAAALPSTAAEARS